MIYPRECEIWRACSKKNGRHPNVTLRRTKAGPRLEATDGIIMVSIHVTAAHGRNECEIDPDAFKEAKRRSRRQDWKSIALEIDPHDGTAHVKDGPTFAKPSGAGCPESTWIDPEPTTTIGLNAKKLLELAKALGGEQVLLEIVDDKIRVKIIGDEAEIVGGRYGYIFPVSPR